MSKILHLGPWGYSMELNNFYKIVKETPKTVTVEQIGSKTVSHEAHNPFAGREVPDETVDNINYKGKFYRLIKNPDGTFKGKCNLSFTHTLKPVTPGQSFSFDHCD